MWGSQIAIYRVLLRFTIYRVFRETQDPGRSFFGGLQYGYGTADNPSRPGSFVKSSLGITGRDRIRRRGNPYYPYLLEPRRPVLRKRTYLPVTALPVRLDGEIAGWVWWNDKDTAGYCEALPAQEGEHGHFGAVRWYESMARRVAQGMKPSAAVADIRANGADPAPRWQGEAGTIDADAQPLRLPYREFLRRIGSTGAYRGPLNDDVVFQLAGPQYEKTVPADAPVSFVTYEHHGTIVGWLWWNDALGASWLVPSYVEPLARYADGITVLYSPAWVVEMKAYFDEGMPPGQAIGRLMSLPPKKGHIVPSQTPLIAPSLAHLRMLAGGDAYESARAALGTVAAVEQRRRNARKAAYLRKHPAEA